VGAHPFLELWLNQIKLVYYPEWPDARLTLIASTSKQLGVL